MADLTANDVSVAINPSDREIAGGGAFKNLSMASITFGNGSLTYPVGGIPMPAIGKFGFHKALHMALIPQPPDNGFVYKYDKPNHKLRIYTQGVATGATAAAVNENGALVKKSSGAEGAVRLPNTVASTTYDLGPMIELPVTVAPVAVTLQLLLIGE